MPDIEMHDDLSMKFQTFGLKRIDDGDAKPYDGIVGQAFDSPKRTVLTSLYPIDMSGGIVRPDRPHTDSTYEIIYTNRQLREFLEISASASGSWGAGSLEASVNYYNEAKRDARSIYLAIRITRRTHKEKILGAKLSENFIHSAHGRSAPEVYEQWGDRYVNSADLGGELVVLFKYSFRSKWDFEKFSLDMKGSYGSGKGKLNIRASKSLLEVFSSAYLEIIENGTKASTEDFVDVDEDAGITVKVNNLIDHAERFPSRVDAEGIQTPIRITTLPLNRTENWNSDIPVMDLTDELVDIDAQSTISDELLSLIYRWENVRDQIDNYMIAESELSKWAELAREMVVDGYRDYEDLTSTITAAEREPFSDASYPAIDFGRYNSFPPAIPVSQVAIHTYSKWQKRDPSSGKGWGERGVRYTVDPNNPTNSTRWFPHHNGTRCEVYSLRVALDPMPAGIELAWGVNFVDGARKEGLSGNELTVGPKVKANAVSFKLIGPLADAYFVEYQCHVGRGGGDTGIAGNTDGSTTEMGTFLGKGNPIEGVRLTIYPKVPVGS